MKFIMSLLIFLTLSQTSFSKDVSLKKMENLTFAVETNVPGFEFQGHFKGDVKIVEGGQKMIIDISKLETGMSLRDNHMRDKVFNKTDIYFEGKSSCEVKEQCYLKGTLTIAGTSSVLKIPLIRKGPIFRLNYKLKLSDFKIKAPEFMGVKVNNEIAINATLL